MGEDIKIGVQTKGLIEKREDIAGVFRMIRDAGFGFVDFSLDSYYTNPAVSPKGSGEFFMQDTQELLDYFEEHRTALKEAGLLCSQVHAPYPVYVERRKKQNDFMENEVIPKCFAIAESLGAPYMVIHPSKVRYNKNGSIEKEKELNLKYFETLIPIIKETGVKVCFENLYETGEEGIIEGPCADPREALYYIETLNERAGEECFGFCLDSGHLNLIKRGFADFASILGEHIKVLHIHDNDGVADNHQIPFTFRGIGQTGNGVDWDNYLQSLHAVSFDGVYSFETFTVLGGFPGSLRPAALKCIYEVGRYFASYTSMGTGLLK
ncbi:MAG: sugar phosphate isomerase/epimerase [Lachnospiraceae bacterium]|nr:sugar phosphate isomerase/epimerase [Lachnospiraceae bacterium]